MEARTGRSELTRAAIVDAALDMATAEGLESLTIGEVAKRLGLSKSGVFSRVGSREALQVAVIEEFNRRFVQDVLVPAVREPRGLARLNAIVARWLKRVADDAMRGCLYTKGSFEYDNRRGPVRDMLEDGVRGWRSALKRSVIQAIDCGHLRPDTDADQLVFEMDTLFFGLMHDARFLGDPRAGQRTWAAWRRLLEHYATATGTAASTPEP